MTGKEDRAVPERFEIVTFDCYGTLIDWEAGISSAFLEVAREAGHEPTARAVIEAHEAVEPAIQRGPYRSYRDVLALAEVEMARRLGFELDPTRSGFLADSLPGWTPFEDTSPGLERLRDAGYRLGILSNIDESLLQGTLEHFTVEFDLMITAEEVQSYKPAHGHFLAAREQIVDVPWVHAARSHFHDVTPCAELGIPSIWVNRSGSPPSSEAVPLAEVGSLAALADWLEA
jgi:2-haloacid dehalogenase/putative hydrolase of the HAD superfamily